MRRHGAKGDEEGIERKGEENERVRRYEIGREREREIRKVHRSNEEEAEEEKEVATGQSPRARIYITVPALTHSYT